ncbi:MAG: molybdenum cofactor biosynthesis protein MoaE [Calditrichaeota bacterium]|nr:MAG: molybdenum cofactor biosynthesis protein MoaE [Calditrichota bacterium]
MTDRKDERSWVAVGEAVLEVEPLLAFVRQAHCGAIDLFVGTVRNHAEGRAVAATEYEGYPEMGVEELQRIAGEALARWELGRVAVHHRLGLLPVGEASVVIAVSAPHRQAAFQACRYIIEAIKERLPVWKKEHWTDGATSWKYRPH